MSVTHLQETICKVQVNTVVCSKHTTSRFTVDSIRYELVSRPATEVRVEVYIPYESNRDLPRFMGFYDELSTSIPEHRALCADVHPFLGHHLEAHSKICLSA